MINHSYLLTFLFLIALFFPFVSFAAQEPDAQTLQVIALLREQIRLLEEIIKILISRIVVSAPIAVAPTSELTVPVPVISANEKPFVRISANGSGGQISIKKGDSATLSWELSPHGWGYCGKSFGWEGAIKPSSSSEEVGPFSYDTRFDIFCYINSTKYTDSVTIFVTQPVLEQTATTTPPKPTFSITDSGFKSCSLEVSRNIVTIGKDAIEATWTVDSDPRNAFFYWRGKDNGVDIGKVYGGKTQRVRTFEYGAYPAKYERYVDMFFAQEHYVGNPYTSGCTTNTVVFEVKQ